VIDRRHDEGSIRAVMLIAAANGLDHRLKFIRNPFYFGGIEQLSEDHIAECMKMFELLLCGAHDSILLWLNIYSPYNER
jgi:hypothetical protein